VRTVVTLLAAGILAALLAGSVSATPTRATGGIPLESPFETVRRALPKAIKAEQRALRATRYPAFREALRESMRELDDASAALVLSGAHRGYLEEALEDIQEARELDDEALDADTEAGEEAKVRRALRLKRRAAKAFGVRLGFAATTTNNRDRAADDDVQVRFAGPGPAGVAVNEVWFTSRQPVAESSDVAVFDQWGVPRFTPSTLESALVHRYELEQPLVVNETLVVSFGGLPSGTQIVIDLVSFDRGVQRLVTMTE
jgi:tetratricopeptide (TPR) repeat protein